MSHSTPEAELVAGNVRPMAPATPTRDMACTARMGNDNRDDDKVFYTKDGECFHTSKYCPGLRTALAVYERRPCGHCSGVPVIVVEGFHQGTALPHDVTIRDKVRQHEQRGLMKVHPTMPV